jgi:hypothetical protein
MIICKWKVLGAGSTSLTMAIPLSVPGGWTMGVDTKLQEGRQDRGDRAIPRFAQALVHARANPVQSPPGTYPPTINQAAGIHAG